MINDVIFSKSLKNSLEKNGISREELSLKLGMGLNVFNNYLENDLSWHLDSAIKICDELGEDLTTMLGRIRDA